MAGGLGKLAAGNVGAGNPLADKVPDPVDGVRTFSNVHWVMVVPVQAVPCISGAALAGVSIGNTIPPHKAAINKKNTRPRQNRCENLKEHLLRGLLSNTQSSKLYTTLPG